MSARNEPRPKLGAGSLAAWFRAGLAEFRALWTFSPTDVGQPTQHGMYGTKTQGEVAQERKRDAREAAEIGALNEEPDSVLDGRESRGDMSRDDRDREPPGLDLG